MREPWVSWFGAINRFVARQTPIANPASGPPTQSTSSPLSNAGSKRCRANGVGLLTVPGISRIDRGEWEKIGIGRAAAQSVQPLETAIIHQKSARGRFARSDRDCVMNSRGWVVRFDFSMSAACPVRVPGFIGRRNRGVKSRSQGFKIARSHVVTRLPDESLCSDRLAEWRPLGFPSTPT